MEKDFELNNFEQKVQKSTLLKEGLLLITLKTQISELDLKFIAADESARIDPGTLTKIKAMPLIKNFLITIHSKVTVITETHFHYWVNKLSTMTRILRRIKIAATLRMYKKSFPRERKREIRERPKAGLFDICKVRIFLILQRIVIIVFCLKTVY